MDPGQVTNTQPQGIGVLPSAHMKKFKIVFLGDLGVGKTSIINQFMYGTFDPNHQPTIGIDFLSKTMYIDDRTFRLQLWDTAGQERFRSLIPNYIRDCTVAVIVFDITQRSSFLSLDKWVEDVKTERGGDVVIAIVANKSDLLEKRAVSYEEAEEKAKNLNVLFVEVSAKTGNNVKLLFGTLSKYLPGMQDISMSNAAEFGGNGFKLEPTPQPKEKADKCKC
ncbi:unnamed protein product [Blepharisma stoltei]|uniref:Uncharacterized protein n=1 Tax=Blepharisma stoltei TaxID=1481888 RepID=A0AAU9IPL2_9CILI|nr:unnamed protein product [Blepharisma stoltei]